MINNWIKPHTYKIFTIPGYSIAIDLFFKYDFKFRIISIYLPCNYSQLRLKIQNEIIQWIQDAISANIQPIVLGDFNVSDDHTHSSSIKHKLLQFLQCNNMYNLATHTQSLTTTWQNSRFQSCIDYIWVYDSIIRYLTSFHLEDSDTSTRSNHKILISLWTFPYALFGKQRHQTRTCRRVFLYKNMINEQ